MRVAALCAALTAVAGCGTMKEEPFLVDGDANGATVRYGSDRALADNVAERHCVQYGRVARFIGRSTDTANYECDLR
jgi:hypothetical protein